MSHNRILARKALGATRVDGKSMILSAATKTSNWNRPESIVSGFKESLEKAVEKNPQIIPAGTVEVCTREADHQSDADSRSHITAVCYNDKGEVIQSIHLPTGSK